MYYDFDASILNIADDFYEAYLRCSEEKNPTVDEYYRTRYEAANIPAIVNGAFAIELYIKSMSALSDEELKKRRHNIKSLLRAIEPSIQAEIKKEVESKLGNSQTYDECLKGISDAFVFWRYIHEKTDFGFGLNNTLNVLPIFLDIIRTIAKRYNR